MNAKIARLCILQVNMVSPVVIYICITVRQMFIVGIYKLQSNSTCDVLLCLWPACLYTLVLWIQLLTCSVCLFKIQFFYVNKGCNCRRRRRHFYAMRQSYLLLLTLFFSTSYSLRSALSCSLLAIYTNLCVLYLFFIYLIKIALGKER